MTLDSFCDSFAVLRRSEAAINLIISCHFDILDISHQWQIVAPPPHSSLWSWNARVPPSQPESHSDVQAGNNPRIFRVPDVRRPMGRSEHFRLRKCISCRIFLYLRFRSLWVWLWKSCREADSWSLQRDLRQFNLYMNYIFLLSYDVQSAVCL